MDDGKPSAETAAAGVGPILDELRAGLRRARDHARVDPFSNPILLQALELTRRIDRGEVTQADLAAVVRRLTAEAFADRAARLGAYLGETDPDAVEAAIAGLIGRIAGGARAVPFEVFRAQVERAVFGIVLTAHPTFSVDLPQARALAEIATGRRSDGSPLAEAARAALLDGARTGDHRPPQPLTLAVEHVWSLEALTHAHEALDRVYRIVLTVARACYPERWTELSPRLVTLASWVGYDHDGRADITWNATLRMRLEIKRAALTRHCRTVEALVGRADRKAAAVLKPIAETLVRAHTATAEAADSLPVAGGERAAMTRFARILVGNRTAALVDTVGLRAQLAAAIGAIDDPALRQELLVLRASFGSHGLGLAHIHVRLNARQLHNAVRKQVGMETTPDDPAHRRTYFNAINELLEKTQPVTVNIGSLLAERTSAKRMFMVIAQILKHIDSETPIRFLIAETESGFTLLTALYYAQMFGVADKIEISPLFETEEALARGEAVIDEALRSRHFRDYLRAQGRLAVQFGFSDSGRYLGQLAATFRIERLRLRLATLMERHGLTDIEVVLFSTHGESIGRGGHPVSFADRLRYVAPPVNRAEFARRGIAVKEEVSFQGGDGYVPLLSQVSALALMRGALAFAFEPDPEAKDDPIYAEADYAAEFFATIQQSFSALVDDPSYAALLGMYGTGLLYVSGSRPTVRESEEWSKPAELAHPSQIRAIPNNAILQQLGMLANTLYGLGRASAKDPELFAALRTRSPRFRRALALVEHALAASDLDVLRAYVDTLDPGMWLNRSGRTRSPVRAKELRALSALCERIALRDRLTGVVRRLQRDYLLLTELDKPAISQNRDTLILLHVLRIALIHRIYILATHIPEFSAQRGVTWEALVEQVLRLDVPDAVGRLREVFPIRDTATADDAAFDEPASYRADAALSYESEHRQLFDPILDLHAQCRRISAAITYLIGAVG
ncbi:MAG: phosphoenolpyruvate carboxylase [Rhodospirillales bacterium]|nr:phosphoenolpyruvate carboxylase [Rhodospirillales bacterium]